MQCNPQGGICLYFECNTRRVITQLTTTPLLLLKKHEHIFRFHTRLSEYQAHKRLHEALHGITVLE